MILYMLLIMLSCPPDVTNDAALLDPDRTQQSEVCEKPIVKKDTNVDDDDDTIRLSDVDDDDDVVFRLAPVPAIPDVADDSVLPISSLPRRFAVTPLRSASQHDDSGDPTRRATAFTTTSAAVLHRQVLIDDEEIVPFPVLSPEVSPIGSRPASPVARAAQHDSQSLSETDDHFLGKREQRQLNTSAYADTSQWRPQWRPEADDDFKVPFLAEERRTGEQAATTSADGSRRAK
jgi:hypothetical protein